MKHATTKYVDKNRPTSRGWGIRGFWGGPGHCYGRGKGINNGNRKFYDQGNTKNGVQCHHWNGYGHIKADSLFKDKKINFAAEGKEEENYNFMDWIDKKTKSIDIWFIYSFSSNYMIGA